MLRLVLLFLFAATLLPLAGPAQAETPADKTRAIADTTNIKWQQFGEDLEVAQVSYQSTPFFWAQVTFVRTALKQYRVGVIRAAEFSRKGANVSALCRLSGGAFCINANFFDQDGNPLGIVISRGISHQKMHKGGKTLTGVFQIERNELRIVNRSDFNPGSVLEAIQAGPRLITGHEPVSGVRDEERTRRSGVCIDRSSRLLFFAVSSDFIGLSIGDLQKILIHPDIDCEDALNLDGGGSSQLYLSNHVAGAAPGATELFIRGRDDVPIALALFPTT